MTAKKRISKPGNLKIDGKRGPNDQLLDKKMTAKYTIWRSKEDIKNLHNVKEILRSHFSKSYNTDSEIYRDLPKLTAFQYKKIQDLQMANEELTAKLEQLEDLRSSICRIFELCEVDKIESRD